MKKERFFIYKHLDKNDNCLYVGLTTNMKSRQMAHRSTANHRKIINKIVYAEVKNRLEMEVYEKYYINRIKPPYNTTDNRGDDVTFLSNINPLVFKKYIIPKNTNRKIKISEACVSKEDAIKETINNAIAILSNAKWNYDNHKKEFNIIYPEDTDFYMMTGFVKFKHGGAYLLSNSVHGYNNAIKTTYNIDNILDMAERILGYKNDLIINELLNVLSA